MGAGGASAGDSDPCWDNLIADLNVYTTNMTYNPADMLYVFASSNSDYSTAGSTFALTRNTIILCIVMDYRLSILISV